MKDALCTNDGSVKKFSRCMAYEFTFDQFLEARYQCGQETQVREVAGRVNTQSGSIKSDLSRSCDDFRACMASKGLIRLRNVDPNDPSRPYGFSADDVLLRCDCNSAGCSYL